MTQRALLAEATARYFDELDPRAAAEEKQLAYDLACIANEVDYDNWP